MSHKIDKTGETLTPEMAQKGEAVKDDATVAAEAKAAEEAKAKEDADAKAATDKEAEDAKKAEDEAKAKADEEAKGKSDTTIKKRSIYDDLKDKKKEAREAKSETETVKAERDALKAENEALKKLTESAKKAETDEDKEQVEDDIKAVAEAIGGDPKAIQTLTDFLTKRLVKNDSSEISKEDIEAVKNFNKKAVETSAKAEFAEEFKGFVPALKADFPHISDEDLASVEKELFRLAHTKNFHDKEVEYIYFKHKSILSKLVSPKRQSMEGSGNNANQGNGGKAEVELSSKSSPLDVMKAMEKPSAGSGIEIRPGR